MSHNIATYQELPVNVVQLITAEQAWHYHVVPVEQEAGKIVLLTSEEHRGNLSADELEMLLGKSVQLELTTQAHLVKLLSRYYRKSSVQNKVTITSRHADNFLEQLITEAKSLGSSDIHIEIYKERARVRMRIDGHLIERYEIEQSDYPALVNKIKIQSKLDIAEKRLPQDGRIQFGKGEDTVDIRVSVLPTLHGEKVVMRLLNNDATNIDLGQLGMMKDQHVDYMEGIRQPNGIILISGPTGSGKTTTLYATLKILNEEKRNVVTVEDPIEYTLEGINQVQLKENIGLTFASALRSFLRQDPDVIMLGEIRDGETAEMAVRAALTGHLVLSTIHTNSAWGTISRLIDMGVPPFLLSNTLNTSVAQRLVRLLCEDCKETHEYTGQDIFPKRYKPGKELKQFCEPVGCEKCYFTGYKGRQAIYEIIPIDREFSDKIKQNEQQVDELFEERNIHSLSSFAFQLFAEGKTSIDEVYPIILNSL